MRFAHLSCLMWVILLAGCASLGADRDALLRLEQVHPFGATALAYNHDGSLLATGGFHGEIRVWRMPAGTEVARLAGTADTVRGLAWLSDSTLLGAAEDGTLVTWNVSTRRVLRRMATAPLNALVLVPGKRQVVLAHKDGSLRAHACPMLDRVVERKLGSEPRALAVTRDGATLAAATADGRVLLLDPQLRIVKTLMSPPRDVMSLRFSPDGRQLVAGAWFDVMRWDVDSGRLLAVQGSGHFGKVISLDFTPDGKHLVTLGRISDSSLVVTDAATGAIQSRMTPLPLCGWMLQVSPDGRYVAAGSEDGSVQVYAVP